MPGREKQAKYEEKHKRSGNIGRKKTRKHIGHVVEKSIFTNRKTMKNIETLINMNKAHTYNSSYI